MSLIWSSLGYIVDAFKIITGLELFSQRIYVKLKPFYLTKNMQTGIIK